MIPVEDLRTWLGYDLYDTSQDALITALEARVVDRVQRKTGRYFGPVSETTQILIGDGGFKLRLAEIPTTLPATVQERTYPGAEATTITASADDGYELRSLTDPAPNLGWLVRKGGCVWTRGCEYTVTYDRGYAAGQEPGQIQQLVINLVQFEWEIRKRKGGAVISETYDKVSVRMADVSEDGMPSWALDTIADWQPPIW